MNRESITSTLVGRTTGFPEASILLIELGHLVVADAEQEPSSRRLQQLEQAKARRNEQGDLGAELEKLAPLFTDEWAGTWYLATLALIAVDHPWFTFDDLSGGALHRRIDALYDQFETDFCAHEVQARYMEIVMGLVDAAESGSTKALKMAASVGLGAAGGVATVHGIVSGMSWATKAAAWLQDQGMRPTRATFDLANVTLVWSLLPGVDQGWTPAEEVMVRRCQEQFRTLASRNTADQTAVRMWRSVLELMGAELHEGVAAPDLVGSRLDAARKHAETYGLTLTTVDGARSGLEARDPWLESNWKVVAQHPLAGEPVGSEHLVVAVIKDGERADAEVHIRVGVKFQAVRYGM